ncbi:hypothetical protein HY772_01085 [Candidatus Woesearchaeota archaeon]|nr:hypothetical protein [Candidatus Woesearchaeota archaeon]
MTIKKGGEHKGGEHRTAVAAGACDGALFTHVGLEELAAQEISEILPTKGRVATPVIGSGVVLCTNVSFLDLCILTYRSQIASSVVLLVSGTSIRTLEELRDELGKESILRNIRQFVAKRSFAVRVRKEQGLDVSTREQERAIGELIFTSCSSQDATVDLENPAITFLVHVSKQNCFFGIDLAGFDLGKRNYKIFLHADSIKATVAYALVRLSGFSSKKKVLDPRTKSGSIPIEAALYALGRSPHQYEKERFAFLKMDAFKDATSEGEFFAFENAVDKEAEVGDIFAYDDNARNVKAAERNAKIAGVNKKIYFSRTDMEWLDTKFDKESLDCIAVNWQSSSRLRLQEQKKEDKLLAELFYSAKYILKKEGKIAILVKEGQDMTMHAAKHEFALVTNVAVMQGLEQLRIQVFSHQL